MSSNPLISPENLWLRQGGAAGHADEHGGWPRMSKTTPATRALQKLGVKFVLHTYVYDSDAEHIGLQAAEALGGPRSTASRFASWCRRTARSA